MKNASIMALALAAVVLFGACGRGDSGETSSDGSETKTEITDQESMTDTVTSTETTKTDSNTTEVDTTENVTTPPDITETSTDLEFPEPGEAMIDSSQPPIKQSDLAAVLEATGCPKELLPSVGEGMTDEELEGLLPYFRDLAVQSILSGDPFAKPEEIDLKWLLYYQYGQTEGISEEERKAFFGGDSEEDFIGTRLTTAAFREILMTYLDVELTDTMLGTLADVTCLEAFDAYYMYHHDYHVVTPIVLQGWHTADGGYLIRFYRINGELSGWEKDWFVHLTPAGDRLVVKQLLSLESPLKH